MNVRKSFLFALLASLTLLIGNTPAKAGDISITVTPWLAPNAYGSPSWNAAVANAVYAEENGLSSYGTGPAAFNAQTTPIDPSQAIVTGFTSWMGVADPTGAYANELGNRMTFAVAIVDTGGTFSISQLAFEAHSSDPGDGLSFGYGAGEYDYSDSYVGVIYNPGGPNTYITSGPNTQLVDAVFGRGSGNSYPAYCSSSPCSAADEQAAIDAVAADPGTPYTFTGTYSVGGASGSGTFNVTSATPEPSSLVLLGTGLIGLAGIARRRFGKL